MNTRYAAAAVMSAALLATVTLTTIACRLALSNIPKKQQVMQQQYMAIINKK